MIDPELPLVIIGQAILGAESAPCSRGLDSDVGNEAARKHPEIMGPILVQAGKVSFSVIIGRLDCSQPSNSGSGKAQLGVSAVNRVWRVAITGREHCKPQLVAGGAGAKLLQRRGRSAIN